MTDMIHCQSCGMPMTMPADYGKNFDGSQNDDYCHHCYPNGEFTNPDETIEQMIESCIPFIPDMNETEARAFLTDFLPKLKRWRR
jgi:hypothetical protein